ncbi:MAG: hypothetical protein JRH11_11980, partial [Deltaproteobacteria bacterium]|nr:hypothetical protein [Deltaproteobacteria bacterium]
DWTKFTFFALVAIVSSIGLYFFWFKNLKSPEECKADDLKYAGDEKVVDVRP